MKRIKTNIPGFDKLVQTGFPKGSSILLSGTSGTGKTIFSLQYIYNGAVKEKEIGIYFTFEEKKESLIAQSKQFGWDLEDMEKKGLIKIISIGTHNIDNKTVEDMLKIIEKTKATRIVIDSITTLSYLTPESTINDYITKYSIKKFLYNFLTKFKDFHNLTSIFISQRDEALSNTIAEYICDGIVHIDYESLGGDYSRNLTIRKMRKTKNDEDLHPLEISNKGIVIHDIE